ncbi:MAG: hypothetical protein KBC91_07745, partial [Candidatus Omnitrophica bacterium]|nr:hypothetical protein [Candidatus Omnitrophota bacterium]
LSTLETVGSSAEEKNGALRVLEASQSLIRRMGMASEVMVSRYLDTAEADRDDLLSEWQRSQSKMMKMLIPEMAESVRPLWPISVDQSREGEIERDLFFGVLKQADWANTIDKQETQPFGYERKEKHGGRFHYASFDHFRGQLDEKIKAGPAVLGSTIPEELQAVLMPFFVGDAMSVETETLKESREEMAAKTLGRWRALAGLLEVSDGQLALKPAIAKRVALEAEIPAQKLAVPLSDKAAVADFISVLAAKRTVWKYALLDPSAMALTNLFIQKVQRDPDWKTLSFGARSVLKLLAYDLLRDTTRTKEQIWPEWEARFKALAAEEKTARGVLPSIGMELQSVNVSPAQVYLWKQALPFFDIPSPERLRYGHIVEPAFRPAWTASAFLIAIPILHRMGLLGGEKYKRAAAFHISLSGDLGPEARWIALPLMMFGREKKEDDEELSVDDKAAQAAWVLSKGYIHMNRENQKADPESEAPEYHTEIRTARLANAEKGSDELIKDYEQFLPAVQYLGAALAAWRSVGADSKPARETDVHLADLWTRYQTELAAIVREIPQAQNLLDADWYESTGDSKDAQLTGELKIFRLMGELYQYKKQHADAYPAFTERVKHLFLNYAEQAKELLNRSEVRQAEVLSHEEQQEELAKFLWKAAGAEPNQPLHWQEHIWDLAGALIDSGVFRDMDLTSEGVEKLAHSIWLAKSGPGRSIHQDEASQFSDWVQARSFVNMTLRPWRDRISPEEPGHVGWSTDTLSGGSADEGLATSSNLDAMGVHVYQVNHKHAAVGGDFYRVVQSDNRRFGLVELADGTGHGESGMQASWFAEAVQETESELGAPLLSILAENGGDAVHERVREYLNILQNKIDVITETKRGVDHFGSYTYQLIFMDYEKDRVYEWRGGHQPAVVETVSPEGSAEWLREEPKKTLDEKPDPGGTLFPMGWMLDGVSLSAVRNAFRQYEGARRLIVYTDGAWTPTLEPYGLLGTVSQADIGGQDTAALFTTLQSRIENVRERITGIENDDVTFILVDFEKGKAEYEKFKSSRSEVRSDPSDPTARLSPPPATAGKPEVAEVRKIFSGQDFQSRFNTIW